MARAERILWYLNFAAMVVLLARIVFCKLHRTYPWSFRYWLAQAVASGVLMVIPLRSNAYFYLFAVAQALSLILSQNCPAIS